LCCLVVGIGLWRSAAAAFVGASQLYLLRAFEANADFLAAGCLLATALTSDRGLSVIAAVCRYVRAPGLLGVGFVLFVAATYHLSSSVLAHSVAVVIGAMWLAWTIGATTPSRWLTHPVARWIGTLSYPLYLWHQWGGLLGQRAAALFGGAGVEAWMLGCTASLAVISYVGVERPILSRRDRVVPPVGF
jgi:peptidoglycan/LPS O-acetylase OafA/YrhL